MIKILDNMLDRVTMYRLVLYYLVGLLAVAFVLSFLGMLPVDPTQLAFSTAIIFAICWVLNAIFARVYNVPENRDSVIITALILALIIEPTGATDVTGLGALVFATVWATASKYIFAIRRKHIFNPAAFGVAASGLLLDQPATWWIAGNAVLLPFVLIGGILVVRKVQRTELVSAYFLATALTIVAMTPLADDLTYFTNTVVYSPMLFFAFVMLTEPLTTPPGRLTRIAYGALVGFLTSPGVHVGSFYFTPENALLIGNVFAFAVSPKGRFELTLVRIERSAADAFDFIFGSDRKLAFQAGQYLEFALGVPRGDSRGNRRYFTVASAPTEDDVRLGVKFNPSPSAFKRGLAAMKPGDKIFASQLAGDFVLPADRGQKLAFLAAGIGITPFRSMLQYLLDRGEERPIVLLYAAERMSDFAYTDVIDEAGRKLGVRAAYTVARDDEASPGVYRGFIDGAMIRSEIPDYGERTFFISGPRPMVLASRDALSALGVPRSRIKVDFFPGFA